MIEKLSKIEKLNREEVYAAIYSLFEMSQTVKVYRHLQDYSGNFDEIFNSYSVLNIKQTEQLLIDYYLDNIDLENANKQIEHVYFVDTVVNTYLKCEALKIVVKNYLKHKVYATNYNAKSDFIIFDNNAVVVLDLTKEGAVIGGVISTNKNDIEILETEFVRAKTNCKNFLDVVPAEQSILKNVVKKIKEINKQLNNKLQ